MSVVNEGLLARIKSLREALEHLDRKYRKLKEEQIGLKNLDRKYRRLKEEQIGLKREHAKCESKRKIKFLYR
jgi:hypothetical protein